MRLALPRSIRGRVLAAALALVAIGLLVANVATYAFLKSFLLRRVDQQLQAAVFPVARQLEQALVGGPDFGRGPPPGVFPPLGTYGAYVNASGRIVIQRWFGSFERRTPPAPALPPTLPGSLEFAASRLQFSTVGASVGPGTFRTLAVPLRKGAGTLVVAIPLTETTRTLRRLLIVQVLGTATVLFVTGGLALWLVRLGLQPIDRMAETAGAIAEGDLSRRVEPAEEETEVGRLGLALNKMLARIEEAFGRQRASEERLRQFVADASHELRTPITSIRGWAELFRRGASERPDDLAKAMSRIEAEADRMGFLVEDLLLLARLDQGKPLARERVDLTALVTRAVDDATAADRTRRIDLHVQPAVVEGDEPRLKQVLDNLLANVRVHTPPGTPATVTLKADGEAIVDVADEGPGVPNEIADRIFERFFRADASRGRDKGGAGLGLAIASEIVRAHGGNLELVPGGAGATFRMTLPLTSARTSDAASHIHSEP
jgi:two-component system OmpR family sensor kinase